MIIVSRVGLNFFVVRSLVHVYMNGGFLTTQAARFRLMCRHLLTHVIIGVPYAECNKICHQHQRHRRQICHRCTRPLVMLILVANKVNKIRAGIFKHSMGARNRGGIGLSYRPAKLHRLAEFIPWNRFLGSINV
jgi:hypothetical protein